MEKSNSNISKNLLYTQKHFDLLVKLYKISSEEFFSLEQIYNVITETAADGLNVDRVSFWILVDNKLVCNNLYDAKDDKHIIEGDLLAVDFPIYFKALKDGIAIVADDALTNKYTEELKEDYLIPLGINEMLDLPIRENGVLIGVLCCEHKDKTRKWNETDLAFARSIGDILTLMLEQNKRREIEKKLIESERKLSLITNNSKDGFVVFENKVITYISPSYCEMLGYSEEEASKLTLEDIFNSIHPDDIELVKQTIYNNLSNKIKNFSYEFRFKAKFGNYFWREDTASVLYNSDGNYEKYIIISRDISLVKNAKNEIEKLYSKSKNLNERLLDFTHIISHNIRSNTSNMTMLIDLIDDANDVKEKEEYFQFLKETNTKLTDTIFYLNETVDIQLSSTENKAVLNLKVEIEKTLIAINGIVKNNNVQFKYLFSDDFEINTIPSYFESILLNLITNAIKYKSADRNLVITIKAEKNDNKTTLIFIDNGIGINLQRNKDKIFGMYKTFHGNSDAVGLGLFMTKNHIEALGGTIDVSSEVGVGTEFNITFYE